MKDVIGLILGGGRGSRLYPLTKLRSKPAVPLAGKYRLIDIPISNCLNSGLKRVFVLTQFLSVSLHRHIAQTYKLDQFSQGFVEILAAQQTSESMDWYQGTADAVRQNVRYVQEEGVRDALILSGDQLYRMDFQQMLDLHRSADADITIAVIPVHRSQCGAFGILRLDDAGRVIDFCEKPKRDDQLDAMRTPADWIERRGVASKSRQYLASMGIYLFKREILVELLNVRPPYTDFGKDLFPQSYRKYKVQAHLFDGYWEDVGTIKAYHEASLALAAEDPPPFVFNHPNGVIYTRMRFLPASKLYGARVDKCLIADGCMVHAGAKLERAICGVRTRLEPNVTMVDTVMIGADRYESDAEREKNRSLGVPNVGIGEGSVVERAIIDKDCRIGRNVRIVNRRGLQDDEGENYCIREGIVCIPKSSVIPDNMVI